MNTYLEKLASVTTDLVGLLLKNPRATAKSILHVNRKAEKQLHDILRPEVLRKFKTRPSIGSVDRAKSNEDIRDILTSAHISNLHSRGIPFDINVLQKQPAHIVKKIPDIVRTYDKITRKV